MIRSVSNSYDPAGNLTQTTDGDGNVTSNSYDGNLLIKSVLKDPSGRLIRTLEQSVAYDGDGNVVRSVDGNGNETSNCWYAEGQLVGSMTADIRGNLISWVGNSYDRAGNLVSSTDLSGNQTVNS